ncbi:DNA replication/repair protein RecF [Sphingosinicella humi]|uniref:DNA replication and repair protein RecF n=1 Tax=Allosphingosinicella humi TaxID=2068657 RepID=A0A2U2J3H7_9SPHN|nr:DNA replication/repair protein RecF [Sphingosinicella humi]PWG02895.1 DNA replication/repair protein RecF [Sphingosinicella humi]
MYLARLSLTHFRSYADALIAPGPGFVVLTGENGAGKTNVLEAVSLLSPGRGLRGATLTEMARKDGPGGFAVAARLEFPLPLAGGDQGEGLSALAATGTDSPSREREGSVDIGTGTTASAPERRQVRINGAPASATSLSEWLSVLWLTPAMDRLFTESPGGRRRFLDRLVLGLRPDHAVHAARYEAAMRARNKLLAEERPDTEWLAALEARMAEHGAALAEARAATVEALGARLSAAPEGPFARAGLALEGGAGENLARELASGRGRDAAAGRTLAGPHRADLAVTHLGKNQPAALCSTGEQKALLLGIVLAHADLVAQRAGRRPILLLDEVAAHLDPTRRAALFDRLAAAGGQVWLTGTERSLFGAIGEATWLDVENGKLRPHP